MKNRSVLNARVNVQFLLFHADIDECKTNRNNCHVKAMCNNTIGSFKCVCNDGYWGNGVTCQGTNGAIKDYQRFSLVSFSVNYFESHHSCLENLL